MKHYLTRIFSAVLALTIALSCTGFVFAETNCPSAKFVDVPGENNWAHKGIDYVVSTGLFSGTSETTFSPNENMTRAMLATVLFRLCGSKLHETVNPFSDIPDGKWYTDGVIWAYNEGIASGTGNGKFSPNDPVTREQVACMLVNCAKYNMTYKETIGEGIAKFTDQDKVHSWAKEAMSWCVNNGFISGIASGEKTLLAPNEYATRAQIAAMLMNFVEGKDPEKVTESFIRSEECVACDIAIGKFDSLAAKTQPKNGLKIFNLYSYTLAGKGKNNCYFFDPYGIGNEDFVLALSKDGSTYHGSKYTLLPSEKRAAMLNILKAGFPDGTAVLNVKASNIEKYAATQLLIWEITTGERNADTFELNGNGYAVKFTNKSGTKVAYDAIVKALSKRPSIATTDENLITLSDQFRAEYSDTAIPVDVRIEQGYNRVLTGKTILKNISILSMREITLKQKGTAKTPVYFIDPVYIGNESEAFIIAAPKSTVQSSLALQETLRGTKFTMLSKDVQNIIYSVIDNGYPNKEYKAAMADTGLSSDVIDTEMYIATQILIWEFSMGYRSPTAPYKLTNTALYDGIKQLPTAEKIYNDILSSIN